MQHHLFATGARQTGLRAGRRRSVFLVLLSRRGLNLLGLLVFIVGIVFTGALSLLIGAALYDELARASIE